MCLGKGFSGTVEYDPFYGDPRITVFDPLTEKFNQLHSMAHGRWYATAITLSDGRILAFSGLNETGQTNSAVEMYTVASGWSSPYAAPFVPPPLPLAASPAEWECLRFGKFKPSEYLQPVEPYLDTKMSRELTAA